MTKDGSLRIATSLRKRLGGKSFSSPRISFLSATPKTANTSNRNKNLKDEVGRIQGGLRHVKEMERFAENPFIKKKEIPHHLLSL
jgi:hypothetical protein